MLKPGCISKFRSRRIQSELRWEDRGDELSAKLDEFIPKELVDEFMNAFITTDLVEKGKASLNFYRSGNESLDFYNLGSVVVEKSVLESLREAWREVVIIQIVEPTEEVTQYVRTGHIEFKAR